MILIYIYIEIIKKILYLYCKKRKKNILSSFLVIPQNKKSRGKNRYIKNKNIHIHIDYHAYIYICFK